MLGINLKQLEVFVCVAETHSFSAAAEKLFLSQSTISSHISSLETEIHETLLVRGSRRKVELTERGEEFYRRCRAIVKSCQELELDYAPTAGELKIGASTVPMDVMLPSLMPAFRAEFPSCRFSLRKGDSTAIHEQMLRGELDVGFVGTVLDRVNLTYRRIYRDDLVMLTPPTAEYRRLLEKGTLGRELLSRPLVVRTQGSGTQMAVDRYLSESGYPTEDIHVVARIESNSAILKSVENGLGNAVLSRLCATDMLEEGRLLEFPLDTAPVTRELYLISRKREHPGEMVQRFIEFSLSFMAKDFADGYPQDER